MINTKEPGGAILAPSIEYKSPISLGRGSDEFLKAVALSREEDCEKAYGSTHATLVSLQLYG